MKRHGRFLSLILAVMLAALMLVSASGLEIFIIASSDEYLSFGTSASYLETIGVMQGYGDGDLHLEEPIQRYQAALFFARVITGITNADAWGTGASAEYKDVPEYGPVIDMVSDMGIVRGYGNGVYGYNDGIRYQDMCAMLVRALGYETDDMVKAYPMSYILKVKELGLDLANVKGSDYLNRGQTAQMVYDALVTDIMEYDADENDRIQAIIDAIREDNNRPAANDVAETYLERNFNVSSTMYFEIVATENYAAWDNDTAEEGYITAYQLIEGEDGVFDYGSEWKIPVEGTATAEVSEMDLIGKTIAVVFDDKEPTAEKLENEDCAIVHASMVKGVTYENLGELSFVKYDEDKEKLTLGTKTVTLEDLDKYALIWQYGLEATDAIIDIDVDAFIDSLEYHTYFALECYDINNDGNYDTIIRKPYAFGQYAERTYSGTKYTMIGMYYAQGVHDTTSTTDKTDENRSYFVEYFLGKEGGVTGIASKSYTNYRPGDTTLKISESTGKLSASVAVSGKEIKSGDFMIYCYNPLVNKLEVVENLGTYQLGAVSGYKTGAQTYTLDGSAMSVGLPGSFAYANGLLAGEGAYASTINDVKTMVANYEKGNNNAKYLEYDGKIIYIEPFGSSEVVVGSDYVVVDMVETLDKHLEEDENATDIAFVDDYAVITTLDVTTGNFAEINVESLTYTENDAVKTVKFDKWEDKQALTWEEMEIYNTFVANGTIYAAEDKDEDGKFELYAYGTEKCNILGAKALNPVDLATVDFENDTPSVYFTYNKSIVYVAENNTGISTERVSTSNNTVCTVIGQDGYVVVKGALGNYPDDNNALWLSDAAVILESTDSQITIFDPVAYVNADADKNVFGGDVASVWNTSEGASGTDGIAYYIMLENTSYNGSAILEDTDGSAKETEDGETLYTHEYRGLYNLVTRSTENVTLVTTSPEAPLSEIINSIHSVIRYDAEKSEATLTSFGEVFVENGEYHYGGFAWLAAKDRISFSTQDKDKNGDGRITGDEKGTSLYYNEDSDKVYQTLAGLNVLFIDMDGGADVDSDEYSFADSYVFYKDDESNRKYYSSVDLVDREQGVDYPIGTFPVKRHISTSGSDFTADLANGRVSTLTAGKNGLISSAGYFRWNGWCDYLIPPVNEDGDTVWTYEGSLRVQVTYYAYIDYDAEADTVDAVVVRIGKPVGVVGGDINTPDFSEEPTDPSYNYTTE